jgi:hypothetical protein
MWFVVLSAALCHLLAKGRVCRTKVKIAWGDCLSTGFFKKRSGKFWGKNLPLVTLSRGGIFGSVIIAGRERKSFCGAFKARKSGGTGRRIGLRAPCHLQRLPNVFGAFSQSHQLRKLAKAGRPRLLYSSNRLQTDNSLSNMGRSLAGSLSSNSLNRREDILSPRPHMPPMTSLASCSVSGFID